MRYITTSEILGLPDSDLVFDNKITGVECEEKRVRLNFVADGRDCVSTNKIYSSDRGGHYGLYTYVDRNNKTWLIGQFKAKYELDGLIEVLIAAEVWCTMDYDGGESEGGEAYVWDSVSDFTNDIYDNEYDLHIGGIISTDSGIDFSVEQNYIFAVNISNVDEFVINWGAPVEVRFYSTSNRTEQVGTRERPFIHETNELFQTETKVNFLSIGNYIAQNILSFWGNGKQNMNLVVNITDDSVLYKVEDIVIILDCSRDEIDLSDLNQINQHSIAQYSDGTAKAFKITSAEFQYDGAFRQALQMIEVIGDYNIESFVVTIRGSGQGSVTPFGTLEVESGRFITLTATPSSGAKFRSFNISKASQGTVLLYTSNPLTIEVNENMTITAVFEGGGIEV